MASSGIVSPATEEAGDKGREFESRQVAFKY
jgi:hypothetical protein